MILTYLIKFDSNGQREFTLPVDSTITPARKQELIKQGCEEVPAAEWQEYCNGKIRGKDGKPTNAPPYVPSKEEQKQAIIAQYESDKAELQAQLIDAILHDDAESQAAIKADMTAVDEQFDADIKEVEE